MHQVAYSAIPLFTRICVAMLSPLGTPLVARFRVIYDLAKVA